MVIMMGRRRRTAPSIAASTMCVSSGSSTMPFLRARSWLMYSSMMTPVCTETPKRARKPTAEETEKLVWVRNSANGPPMEAIMTEARIRRAHLKERNIVVSRIRKMPKNRDGDDDGHPFICALLTLVFAGPLEVIAGRQLHVVIYLANRLFHSRTEIAAAYGVLDGNVALSALSIDFFGAIIRW